MGAFENIRGIASVLKEAGKIEEYKQILELLEKMLEMQGKIADLESKNKDLTEKLNFAGKLEFKNNAYWNEKGYMFCSRCWDKEKHLIRILQTYPNSHYAECPECKNSINFTGVEPTYPTNDERY